MSGEKLVVGGVTLRAMGVPSLLVHASHTLKENPPLLLPDLPLNQVLDDPLRQ